MKLVLLAAMPAVFAGCARTNPDSAFDDLNHTVAARAGLSAQWPRTDSSSNQVAKAVASLLRVKLTAQSAANIALLNNRSLQARFEDIGISQADLAQASRLQNPVISGDWRFPDRPPTAADIQYTAAGNFLDLLTLPARKQIAARNLEQTRLSVAGKVLQLAADTQTAFYELQAQMQLTNRLAIIVAVNDAAADFARRQHAAGNITDLALHEQQASAAQSHFDWMQARAAILADRERLNRLLGLSGGQVRWQIADALPPLPKTDPAETNLEALAVSHRLDLAAARARVESFAAALRLKQHTRFFPGVTVGVDTERTPDGQRVTGPTLDLELPLFDQGQPAVARLAAQYRQAQDDYSALEVTVRSEVRQARDGLLAAREAVEYSQQRLLPLQQEILNETLRQYNAMEKSAYELLFAKQRVEAAQETAISALRDYWVARVGLERAAGGRLSGAIRAGGRESAPSASRERRSRATSAAGH